MRTDKVKTLKLELQDMMFYNLGELKERIEQWLKEDFKIYFDDSTESTEKNQTSVVMVETIFTKLVLIIQFNNLFSYFVVVGVIRLREEN